VPTLARVTVFDLLVLLFVALCAYRGYRRGLVGELFSLAAFLGALVLAFRFDSLLGHSLRHLYTGLTLTEARIIAFLIILIAAEVAAGVLIAVVSRAVGRVPVVGALDRFGGIIIGATWCSSPSGFSPRPCSSCPPHSCLGRATCGIPRRLISCVR
jgi:membrane protein required for colicin V production